MGEWQGDEAVRESEVFVVFEQEVAGDIPMRDGWVNGGEQEQPG